MGNLKKFLLVILSSIIILGCKGKEPSKEVLPPQPEAVATPAVTKDIQKEISPPEAKGQNQPPRVTSVDVSPLYPKVGDTLKITATATDPDGDEVKLIYQWFKNDEPLSETSDTLSLTKDFKRGDRITLNVIPDDGKVKGDVGLMKVTIGNSPPEIISSSSDTKFENRRFIYQVKATDPEGDPLTYSLKTAPAKMTINPSTGLIQWDVPPEFKGKTSVTVYVTDDHGGEAVQSFVFEITSTR